MRFWYNLNGYHMGTLSVFVRTNNGQDLRMWMMKGDNGPNWKRAAVDLNMDNVNRVGCN